MINSEKILNNLFNKMKIIDSADIPAIDLYMDQVTTFMNKQLNGHRRFEDDKILTKTMINNYSKNELLPPPVKKRYSKEHVILLILIYYLKNILSINDIKTILSPICDSYFNNEDSDLSLEDIYNEILSIENGLMSSVKKDISEKIEASKCHFTEVSDDSREFLQLYALISSLCFDVYVKKQMIESIIDSISHETSDVKDSKDGKDIKKTKSTNEPGEPRDSKNP